MANHRFHAGARLGAALATVLATGLVVSGLALASGPPVRKIYDCWAYNTAAGNLYYVQAIELETHSVYLVAPTRIGNHLAGEAAKGRYRAHGHKIKWLTGAYGKSRWTGVYHPPGAHYVPHHENSYDAYIELFDGKGNDTSITCYEH